MKKNTICFVAGRSGGHLIPALTLVQQEKKKNTKTKVLFFSANTKLDKKIAGKAKTIDWHIPLSLENIPGKKLHHYPRFFLDFFNSFFSALHHLRTKKPNKIISTGGYITLPVACAAKLLKIPLHLYELNVVPGKTTKFLAPQAHEINICFDQTKKHLAGKKCVVTPYPNRFVNIKIQAPETSFKKLNFCPTKKTILVLGGSQGSLSLNKCVGTWIANDHDLKNKIQIIHQTGSLDKTDWIETYKNLGVNALVFDFCDNIQDYYQIADLVICRSGAGSLFETFHFGKKCITVPLETKKNTHQLYNAIGMQEMHPELFTVVRQKNRQKLFSKTLSDLL